LDAPEVDLSSREASAASAKRLVKRIADPQVTIEPEMDETTESYRLKIHRVRHGNEYSGVLDRDFLHSGDYAQIERTAEVLRGLIGKGAYVKRGEDRYLVSSFKDALYWLLGEAKKGLAIQRYKGLGEMNPEQLWETTMDPATRRLLRAQIEDATAANDIFTTLMGDVVEPRRAFIESNALGVRNLDI
jgi:DNA gyrase subunit B